MVPPSLYGRRLSIHLMIQPNAAAAFLSNDLLRDQGLLSRLLVAAPDSISGMRFYKDPEPEDEALIDAYQDRILSVLGVGWPLANGKANELSPRALSLSAEATALWRQFFDHIEGQSGRGGELWPVRDFAAKAAEHAARIAGVLTITEDVHAREIGKGAMASAVTLADWYVAEALRLHQVSRTDARLLRAAALLGMAARAGRSGRRISGTSCGLVRGLCGPRPWPRRQSILINYGWLIEVSARPRRFRVIKDGSGA